MTAIYGIPVSIDDEVGNRIIEATWPDGVRGPLSTRLLRWELSRPAVELPVRLWVSTTTWEEWLRDYPSAVEA